jgi:hypothetical protein
MSDRKRGVFDERQEVASYQERRCRTLRGRAAP